MVNSEIRILHDADGHPVANVSFDLSAEQLAATARVAEGVRLDRHRNLALSTDDVLAMRELTGVSDELHRLAEHQAHGTVVLPLARFSALHDALTEWVHDADERGWMREDDQAAYPLIQALLAPMGDLRAAAVEAILGDGGDAADTADTDGVTCPTRPPSDWR